MEVKLKLLVFSFLSLVMQKVENANIHSDCKIMSEKIADPPSVFTYSREVQKDEEHYYTE